MNRKRVKVHLTVFLAIACLILGCESVADRQIERLRSPDGKVDAVLVERNGGATTSMAYIIYIVPKGHSVSDKTRIALMDHVHNDRQKDLPGLSWDGDRQLVISFDKAQLLAFTNSMSWRGLDNFGYVVEVRLKHPNRHFVP